MEKKKKNGVTISLDMIVSRRGPSPLDQVLYIYIYMFCYIYIIKHMYMFYNIYIYSLC